MKRASRAAVEPKIGRIGASRHCGSNCMGSEEPKGVVDERIRSQGGESSG